MDPQARKNYQRQVRQLRAVAVEALKAYAIRVSDLRLINHGENTTYKVQTFDRKKYLLRVHREGYHTEKALEVEMAWLKSIKKVAAPVPVRSRQKRYLVEIKQGHARARYCSLLEWVDGKLLGGSISTAHYFALGKEIAKLHLSVSKPLRAKAKQLRHYWNADGLIGSKPVFGPIDALFGATKMQQRQIDEARKRTYLALKRYERNFPDKMTLIHADLHVQNIVTCGAKHFMIDFDDCGYGFRVYDLVIPMISAVGILGSKRSEEIIKFKEALFKGYQEYLPLDEADYGAFEHLMRARRLLMLGWLMSRASNPKFKDRLKPAINRVLAQL